MSRSVSEIEMRSGLNMTLGMLVMFFASECEIITHNVNTHELGNRAGRSRILVLERLDAWRSHFMDIRYLTVNLTSRTADAYEIPLG